MHPIADLALQLLSKSAAGFELSVAAQRRLEAAVAGRSADRALVKALVEVAYFLHRQGAPRAAQALLAIAEGAAEALRAASTPRKLDRLQDRARTFARFDGRSAALCAPQQTFVAVRAPSPFRRAPARV